LILKDGRLSDLSRENVLPATIIGQDEDKVICRLNNEVFITVPAGCHSSSIGSVRIVVNPSMISLWHSGEGFEAQGNLLPGKVVKIAGGNGQIKTTIDVGVHIDIFLSLPEYARKPPLIGEGVFLHIPDEAITIE
jgi:ABC-type molybdate transport system ATPase subunit